MPEVKVSFGSTCREPVRLERASNLSEHLTVDNSPLLFGCRTGICGTCLITVNTGALPPPKEEEKTLLDILCPGNEQARLACQLELTADIDVEPLKV